MGSVPCLVWLITSPIQFGFCRPCLGPTTKIEIVQFVEFVEIFDRAKNGVKRQIGWDWLLTKLDRTRSLQKCYVNVYSVPICLFLFYFKWIKHYSHLLIDDIFYIQYEYYDYSPLCSSKVSNEHWLTPWEWARTRSQCSWVRNCKNKKKHTHT